MENKNIIIVSALALLAVVVGIWLFVARDGSDTTLKNQVVSTDEPVDIVLDFYNPWLDAVQSTSTDPYTLGLASNPLLSQELRERLEVAGNQPEGELDPVLCDTVVPGRVVARTIVENEDEVQLLVSPREGRGGVSLATLLRHNDGWYIAEIECNTGESAPEREFSFEREGFLLKSVPLPLDSNYWHLVFEENGIPGHTAPLFFDAESMCTADGETAVCDPEQFVEPERAFVQGELSETGVQVKRLELLE